MTETTKGKEIADDFFSRDPKFRTKEKLIALIDAVMESERVIAFDQGCAWECHHGDQHAE